MPTTTTSIHTISTASIAKFVTYCESTLDLHDQLVVKKHTDPNLTFYKSLPICIIDAVFSIGVNYRSVENTLKAFMDYFKLSIPRTLPVTQEYAISDFLKDMSTFPTFEEAAEKAFRNKQRTSSVNGILKAEACVRVAEVFKEHGIETLADFNAYANKAALDSDILKVKGQSSGIMLKYLYMLAGNANMVKPDRHLVNFLKHVFPHLTMASAHHATIVKIVTDSVKELQKKYPTLTPRFLDYLIWDYMR